MRTTKLIMFIEKLSENLENNIKDYEGFLALQQECFTLLDQIQNDNKVSLFNSFRQLGYFKVHLRELLNQFFAKKKRVKNILKLSVS